MLLTKKKLNQFLREVDGRLPKQDSEAIGASRVTIWAAPGNIGLASGRPGVTVAARDGHAGIFLDSEILEQLSETGYKYLIAHEFAHIVLGHPRFMGMVRENDWLYDVKQLEAMKTTFEELADHLAIEVWGFHEEAMAAVDIIGCTTRFMAAFVQTVNADGGTERT